jgi:hypothetical protein
VSDLTRNDPRERELSPEERMARRERAKASEALKITNECFKQAAANLGFSREDTYEPENKEPVGREYIRIMRTLSTELLTTILEENEQDIVRRENSTIQEIIDEISHRILLKEDKNDKNLHVDT